MCLCMVGSYASHQNSFITDRMFEKNLGSVSALRLVLDDKNLIFIDTTICQNLHSHTCYSSKSMSTYWGEIAQCPIQILPVEDAT